jgi:hypothetical protein
MIPPAAVSDIPFGQVLFVQQKAVSKLFATKFVAVNGPDCRP